MKNNKENGGRKYLMIAGKILFTILAVYLIASAADLEKIKKYFSQISLVYLFLALMALNLGQFISALRLQYYFKTIGVNFTSYYSIALYYTGMFFNRLLPSGVGGDGYITYVLKRHQKIKISTSVRLFLSGRANGLLFVFMWMYVFYFTGDIVNKIPYGYVLGALSAITIFICYIIGTKILLREKADVQIGSSKYSFFVQGLVAIAAYILLEGVGHNDNVIDCLMMFMFANAMIILPISIGGMGVREVVYFYGATLMGMDAELGVALSVLYYAMDIILSLCGLFFWHRLGKIKVYKNKTKGV